MTICFECVRAFTHVEAAWRSLEPYIPVNSTRGFTAFGTRNTPSSHGSSGLRSNRCPLRSCSSPGNCSFSVVLCNLGVDTSNGTSNRHARASISNNAITERKNGTKQKRQRLLAEYTRNTGTERELFSDCYCRSAIGISRHVLSVVGYCSMVCGWMKVCRQWFICATACGVSKVNHGVKPCHQG